MAAKTVLNTCDTCRHWTRPLGRGEYGKFQNRTEVYGECNKAGWGEAMMPDGPSGCHECDPYTSKSLITKHKFGCTEWEGLK